MISLHTEKQVAFYKNPKRFIPHEADSVPNVNDDTTPLPAHLEWNTPAPAQSVLCIYVDDACRNCVRSLNVSGKSADVYNLIPGQKYYWKIEATQESGSFEIKLELPRWIRLPNVTNVRDLGGWKCKDGKSIKFGMLYRGGQFEKWTNQKDGSPLTEEGKRVFTEELGIRTELDLRRTGTRIFESDAFQYVKQGYSAYAPTENAPGNDIFSEEISTATRNIFELLAKKESYPVYFHCQGGGDRTGVLAFLLEIECGVSYEDAVTDYELSNLSVSGERTRFTPYWQAFLQRLADFGPDIPSQVHNYLLSCRISESTLNTIKQLTINN